ncbi:MAG: hypothetical protein HY720_02500 [Planctomycetes bacterium]|nr:hypothetical protein [Planctomycetota bacterium]
MIDRRPRAAALVLSLAVLSVLLVLTVSMARLMALERSGARSFSIEVRARMAAEAGVERAVAELRRVAAERSYDRFDDAWIYAGEDWNGDGWLSNRDEDSFFNREFDTLACPVEHALRPSFFMKDPATTMPVLVGPVAASGVIQDPAGGRSVYVLKVADCASQIDVNGGLADPVYAERIARMIDLVWEETTKDSARAPEISRPGKWLLDHRPAAGYSGERELRLTLAELDASNPGLGLDVYRRLSPYLACHPWRDPTAISPLREKTRPALRGLLRYQNALELSERAPVSLNTAPLAVLYASLAGTSGWAFEEGVLFHRDPYSGLPDFARGDAGSAALEDRYERVELDLVVARRVAEEIVAYRKANGAFRTFDDLSRMLAGLVQNKALTRRQADLVLAQGVPDTDLNKFNPDAVLYRAADKTDLIEYGPEFCLSSMGRFEIESYAEVQDANGYAIGTAKILATAKIYDVVRDTTIADFQLGTLSEGLEIYPERELAVQNTYDGQLGLARLAPSLKRKPALHASFEMGDNSWRGAMEEKEGTLLPGPGPLLGERDLGTVFRGGAYSEEGLHPRFSAGAGYLSDANGAIAFWYKPNWDIVSAAPRPHAIVDFNGEPPHSTFQIYNDTEPPDGTSKGLPRHYVKFLAWDLGNERQAGLQIPLERVTGPREWVHISMKWDGKQVVMWVRGSRSSSQAIDISMYRWQSSLHFEQIPSGRWMLTADRCPVEGELDNDFFHGVSSIPNSAPVPWPGGDYTFSSQEGIVAFIDSLLHYDKEDRYESKGYAVRATSGYSGTALLYRNGPSGLIGFAQYGSIGEEIRWGFVKDPTAALRFGGRLKVPKKESSDPDKPPHYEHVVAPSNGTYGDLVTYNGIVPDDATIDDDLKDLFLQGRYYRGGDASFESRALGVRAGARLGSASWRIARPAGSAGVRVRVAGHEIAGPEGAIGAVAPAAGLKYRIEFLDSPPEGEPLLETPFIDSVTVTVLSPVVFMSWEIDPQPAPVPWRR